MTALTVHVAWVVLDSRVDLAQSHPVVQKGMLHEERNLIGAQTFCENMSWASQIAFCRVGHTGGMEHQCVIRVALPSLSLESSKSLPLQLVAVQCFALSLVLL